MITYRDLVREVRTDEYVERLRRLGRAGDALACLVCAGELEQGVVDALNPRFDDWGEAEQAIRAITNAAASLFLRSRRTQRGPRGMARLRRELEALARYSLPDSIRIRAPEGYAHYALDPAAYAAAAARFRDDVGAARAAAAVVIGVRSIGTGLCSIVAAELGAPRTITLRPYGQTGCREVRGGPRLMTQLGEWLADDPDVLIVDEGPGATGETFWCVGRWLEGLGVAPDRIGLLPSHTGGMELAPVERRAWFRAARKYAPAAEDDRARRIADRFGFTAPENLSAGRWRDVVTGAADTPAIVGFERRKFRARDSDGTWFLIRYAGLGEWGTETVKRAAHLAALDAGPEVIANDGGFLVCSWAAGAMRTGVADPEFIRALGAYLVARAALFPTGGVVDRASLVAMLRENAREALGEALGGIEVEAGLARVERRIEALPERPAYIADARLRACEWVRTRDGYVKVDGTDHGDGLRLPGPTDAAWDLAGATIEYDVPGATLDEWIAAVARSTDGDRGSLADAVRAYRAPYAACCLGEAAIGAREADSEIEGTRLRRETARYQQLLARELASL